MDRNQYYGEVETVGKADCRRVEHESSRKIVEHGMRCQFNGNYVMVNKDEDQPAYTIT